MLATRPSTLAGRSTVTHSIEMYIPAELLWPAYSWAGGSELVTVGREQGERISSSPVSNLQSPDRSCVRKLEPVGQIGWLAGRPGS